MKNSGLQRQCYEGEVNHAEKEKLRRFRESGAIRVLKLNRFIEDASGKTVLNAGCGSGDYIAEAFLKDNRVAGIDISLNDLKRAMKYYHAPIQGDMDNGLPLKSEAFDMVITSEVIEHVVDTDLFLYEINRVLKKGGVLVLTTPNVNTPLSLFMMLFFDMPPYRSARYRSPHVRDFTKKTLKIALERNGFKIEKCQGTALFLPYFGYFMSSLCNFLPRLGTELILKAIKIEESSCEKSDFSMLLT